MSSSPNFLYYYNNLKLHSGQPLYVNIPMKFKNLVASGCSFTQDGIGGIPPTLHSNGGCSFKKNDDFHEPAECKSWASFLSTYLDVESFVNFAASGHGITLTSKTIIDTLDRYNYSSDNTFVVFNITSFNRFDVQCKWSDNDRSEQIPWHENLLDYTFAKPRSQLWKEQFLNYSISDIEKINTQNLEKLFTFLTGKKYQFVFTMMEDYSAYPLIQKYKDHLVLLTPGPDMFTLCKDSNLLSSDNFHPSTGGHQQIAKQVFSFIQKKPGSLSRAVTLKRIWSGR
jgi:hypothetical protein